MAVCKTIDFPWTTLYVFLMQSLAIYEKVGTSECVHQKSWGIENACHLSSWMSCCLPTQAFCIVDAKHLMIRWLPLCIPVSTAPESVAPQTTPGKACQAASAPTVFSALWPRQRCAMLSPQQCAKLRCKPLNPKLHNACNHVVTSESLCAVPACRHNACLHLATPEFLSAVSKLTRSIMLVQCQHS